MMHCQAQCVPRDLSGSNRPMVAVQAKNGPLEVILLARKAKKMAQGIVQEPHSIVGLQ